MVLAPSESFGAVVEPVAAQLIAAASQKFIQVARVVAFPAFGTEEEVSDILIRVYCRDQTLAAADLGVTGLV